MSQIEPGTDFTRFELQRGGRKWHLAAPICYEGTFARVCRQMVVQDGRKAAEILVNISNDGWFVWRWGSWAGQGSAEHAQHLVHYCFRAVENRVPVVRAVNTGISASIDSNGRIVGEVRGPSGRSAMLSGTLLLKSSEADSPTASAPAAPTGILRSKLPQVLVDSRVSLYSIVGDLFAQAVSLTAIALGAWMLFASRLRKKRATEERARR
jgi:apolipoprotein N-acyltransferase